MAVVLTDAELQAAHISEAEARLELALTLYAQERLTMMQAARMAGLPFLEFQRERGRRQIPIHYGIEELEADLRYVESVRPR